MMFAPKFAARCEDCCKTFPLSSRWSCLNVESNADIRVRSIRESFLPIQAPNWNEAREQCDFIAGKSDPAMTFQVFDDKAERFEIAQQRSGKLSDPEIKRWLTSKAADGCGVFVTVNETDLKGRRYENMKRFRVAVADFDGEELPTEWPDKPDLIVESSPGKFHAYWLLIPGDDFNAWSDMQARIAHYFGSDPRVHDAPRVFRLAGFWHQKGKPFRTRIVSRTDTFDRNARPLAMFTALFPGDGYDAPTARKDGGRSAEPIAGWDHESDVNRAKALINKPKNRAKPGDRNNKAYRMAALLNDFAISPAKSLELLLEWNDAQDHPLPEGEIHHVIESAPEYKRSAPGSLAGIDAREEFQAGGWIEDTEADEVEPADIPDEAIAKKVSDEDWPPKGDGKLEKTLRRNLGGMSWSFGNEIKPEEMRWLWEWRIPQGKLSIIAGYPDQGKSQILIAVAAIISTGGVWPDNHQQCEPGLVVILSSEDDEADTIIPRLHAAGADVNNVIVIRPMVREVIQGKKRKRVLNLEDDLGNLANIIKEAERARNLKVRMIGLDPLNAYFGGAQKADVHKTADMRALLTPISEWAGRMRIATVGIMHFNKGGNSHMLYRVTDSGAITAIARSVMFAIRPVNEDGNEDKEMTRTLFMGKHNLAPDSVGGLEYTIEAKDVSDKTGIPNQTMPFIEFGQRSVMTAEQAIGMNKPRKADAIAEAKSFLTEILEGHEPMAQTMVRELADQEHNISFATLKRAKKALNIKSDRDEFEGGAWLWRWPTPTEQAGFNGDNNSIDDDRDIDDDFG